MEMEAAQKEQKSLERQLASLMKQNDNLALEVNSQRTKVHHPLYSDI